jgi:hypothetical protein
MQPHGRGGAKSEEDPVVDAILPEGCLPQIVEGALRRMHQMGARVILDPLASIREVLDSAVPGFLWTEVCAALQHHFPGGMFRLEGAVDFIFSIEECLQLHTQSPPISHNGKRALGKEAMLSRYCFCMTYRRTRVLYVYKSI